MNRMEIALFSSPGKAEPLCRRLAKAGIHAEVHDELRLKKLWYVSKASGGARLEVSAEEFERAYQLLLDWDSADGALREAIRCPECSSLRVEYPQFTKKSFIPNLLMGSLAELGLIEKSFYCEDCHYTWPREGKKPRTNRSHLAPYYFIEGVEQTRFESKEPSDAARKAA